MKNVRTALLFVVCMLLPQAGNAQEKKWIDFFSASLSGNVQDITKEKSLKVKNIEKARAAMWQSWVKANEMFDEEKYSKKQLADNQLVTADEPAFKLSKNENWSLVLPIEEAMSQDFLDEEYIKVKFLKNQQESWGQVSIVKGADNETYLQLSFTNSMITFAKDRFVDIELLLHDETGLKIPNTSIVNKEFYLIPRKYITKMDESAYIGSILLETYK